MLLQNCKQILKKYLFKRLNVPYNRYGIPNPLFDFLDEDFDMTFIDIGAHNGYFADSISKYCNVKKGILIEPIPEKALKLRELFTSPRYIVYDCLVSDQDCDVEFDVNELSETSSILHIKRDISEHSQINTALKEKITRKSMKLDTLIDELELDKVDLLKIDVQGAEHLVLNGAMNSLPLIKMIWTEVSFKPLYDKSSTFADIHKFLTENGFKFVGMCPVFFSPEGELLQSDALFIHQ